MKIRYLFLALVLLIATSSAAKFPAQVKKSVTFIFSKDTNNRLTPQGTGFFVLLKTNQNNDTANFGYLVTTKSTLKKSNGSFFDTVYIRINRKDGYSDTLIIPMVLNSVPRYFLHPDSTVDLAIIPAYPDLNRYDFLFTPVGMIAAIDFLKKENISEGDEVFYTGMESSHFGIFKNIPIVRFGKIAQLSEEKYSVENGYTELYLVETNISKESSGSPLFFYSPAIKDTGTATVPARLFLTGIISGFYDKQKSKSNGIVSVIPAYKLNDLLNVPAVMQEREKEFTRMQSTKIK
ncbi:MAG: hypothetical protein WDA22_00700 [Bacteroidota bacterium]